MSHGPVKLLSGRSALEVLYNGAAKLSEAVGATLGPLGKNVIFPGENGPVVTKDGVTVAHRFALKDVGENLAVEIIQQAAAKAAATTGDGTTTTTVLAQGILYHAASSLNQDNPDVMSFRRGMDRAGVEILELLKEYILPESNGVAEHVATLSANGDKVIGAAVGEAFGAVGPDGVVLVQNSRTAETYVETTEGTIIPKGPVSPYFLHEKSRVLSNVYVLYANTRVAKAAPIISLATRLLEKDSEASLLVVGAPVEGDALQFLTQNYTRGLFDCVAIDSPGVGEHHIDYLWDLASVTGGKVIGDELGLKYHGDIDLDVLGRIPAVEISKNQVRLMGVEDSVGRDERVRKLKAEAETETNPAELQRIQDRLSTLSAGIAVIYVGGETPADRKETFFRLEDALGAARTALKDGVIPGGGFVLRDIWRRLRESTDGKPYDTSIPAEEQGFLAVVGALTSPSHHMWWNAYSEFPPTTSKVVRSGRTFDIRTREEVDALESGILDPYKVTYHAVSAAIASAGLLITSACVLIPEDD